jgi:hypothetical protein
MRQLAGFESVTEPELGEFVFSTGEKMSLAVGQHGEKTLRGIANRLVSQIDCIRAHTDRPFKAPSKFAAQITDHVHDLNGSGLLLSFALRCGANYISWRKMCELANPDYVYDPLWTNPGGYTLKELDGTFEGVSVIGMFQTAEQTNFDRRLLLRGHPWDDRYPNGKISQAQAVAEIVQAQPFTGLEIFQTDHRDATGVYVADHIDQIKPNSAIFDQGWMRIPLDRRSVDGVSVVGSVDSYDSPWGLYGSDGDGFDNEGVGLSAGLA